MIMITEEKDKNKERERGGEKKQGLFSLYIITVKKLYTTKGKVYIYVLYLYIFRLDIQYSHPKSSILIFKQFSARFKRC